MGSRVRSPHHVTAIAETTTMPEPSATPILCSYGSWASPISAASLAQGSIGVTSLQVMDGRLFWLENRPQEAGRMVVMTGDATERRQLTPEGFNVRSRVHEYGGTPYTLVRGALYFVNFADQRLYRQRDGGAPAALTPPGYRYADMVAAPGGLIAVREDHSHPAEVKNTVVFLSGEAGDAGRVLFSGSDFVAYPRVSPDGRRLAWMAWDHPNMPWDDTAIYIADLAPEGLARIEMVAGGGEESAMEPQFGPDSVLYFVSDRTGFWNLYARHGTRSLPIAPRAAEFAGPLWTLGQSNFVLMDDGRVVAACSDDGGDHLLVVEPAAQLVREIALPFASIAALRYLDRDRVAMVAGSGRDTNAVATVDLTTGDAQVVYRPSPAALQPHHISMAEAITLQNPAGVPVHALFYPPTNGDFTPPAGEKPPLIVQVHGGPTGQASASFSLATQFWTSRGFALVDVDYGGSSGYGRAYRQRLNGQWGIVDVADVIATVTHLVDEGMADPNRIVIHGGSAGGFTVLAALAQSEVFKAGANFYGVADLTALARDTHKFESRYLDTLIGPYPAAKALYEARSPINHLAGFAAPLIIFQGADDKVVPPNQAHMIRDALRQRHLPVAYLEFAGEGHGFRRVETLIATKEAELYFYCRVFGITPADELPGIAIENLQTA
jgi:dipeptidyl aminopeptidase/acylaminoacyl peptidase